MHDCLIATAVYIGAISYIYAHPLPLKTTQDLDTNNINAFFCGISYQMQHAEGMEVGEGGGRAHEIIL